MAFTIGLRLLYPFLKPLPLELVAMTLEAESVDSCVPKKMSLGNAGKHFAELVSKVLQDQDNNKYKELITRIKDYEIDDNQTKLNWEHRLNSINKSSLYLPLDKYRSMLNPKHCDYATNTTIKYWNNCFTNNGNDTVTVNFDLNIKNMNLLLREWFNKHLLIFAQNSDKKSQDPNHIFYIPLYGNNGIFVNKNKSNSISIGILIIPPHFWYKPHYHPAEEIYIPLNDTDAIWMSHYNLNAFQNQSLWTQYRAGEVIFHPTMIHHSMKTNNKPLLALYCWYGDIITPSKFSNTKTLSKL